MARDCGDTGHLRSGRGVSPPPRFWRCRSGCRTNASPRVNGNVGPGCLNVGSAGQPVRKLGSAAARHRQGDWQTSSRIQTPHRSLETYRAITWQWWQRQWTSGPPLVAAPAHPSRLWTPVQHGRPSGRLVKTMELKAGMILG